MDWFHDRSRLNWKQEPCCTGELSSTFTVNHSPHVCVHKDIHKLILGLYKAVMQLEQPLKIAARTETGNDICHNNTISWNQLNVSVTHLPLQSEPQQPG